MIAFYPSHHAAPGWDRLARSNNACGGRERARSGCLSSWHYATGLPTRAFVVLSLCTCSAPAFPPPPRPPPDIIAKMSSVDDDESYYDCDASLGDADMQLGRVADAAQFRPPPVQPASELQPRARTSSVSLSHAKGGNAKTPYRHSLQEGVPAIPAIPARFLDSGRPPSIATATPPCSNSERSRRSGVREAEIEPSFVGGVKTLSGQLPANTKHASQSPAVDGVRKQDGEGQVHTNSLLSPISVRRKSLPTLTPQSHKNTLEKLESSQDTSDEQEMPRPRLGKDRDLFLELAQDAEEDDGRPPSRANRTESRLAKAAKRRSLPIEPTLTSASDQRPKSSGGPHTGRPSSRLDAFPSGLQRHLDRYRSPPSRTSFNPDDAASTSGRSGIGRLSRYSNAPERSPLSPDQGDRIRSPEVPSFGRRRPSFGSAAMYRGRQNQLSGQAQDSPDESPANSSDRKRSLPDSASIDSQTPDTVWDELDDLKSRIKKLELTGKTPATPGAGASGDSSERPRTATTAPTTIESSPKQERKPDPGAKAAVQEIAVGGSTVANIHPTLHTALRKAKSLLNPSLYRALEATASDALQLAAMTGSAGPQGTAFSAASIINGVTVSDRHVRRKADAMCRNLTDLCLALCEGKHDAASVIASPITLEPIRSSPTIRYTRSSIGPTDNLSRPVGRPMSRLEARRTSILGTQRSTSLGTSPRESLGDVSASEQESTPSQLKGPSRDLRRGHRASSRLLTVHPPGYDDISGDENPAIRPPSRAMTDYGLPRARTGARSEYNSSGQAGSPSFRESLASRRVNIGAAESNRDSSRIPSISSEAGRRRWVKESTPPVVEEEGGEGNDYQPPSQSRRRITSLGHFMSRRSATATELPGRATSLSSRRHVLVE